MTSALKIRCFLKTTAKKFCSRPRGREGEKKSNVLRKDEEQEGGGRRRDRRSEFFGTPAAETVSIGRKF